MAALILDVLLGLLLVGFAGRGWRTGLTAGGLGLVGVIGGSALGLWAGAWAMAKAFGELPTLPRTLALVASAMLGAALGSSALGVLAHRLRSHRVRPLHAADSLFGALGAMTAAAVAATLLGAAVKPIAPSSWARTMDDSRVLTTIAAAMPDQLTRQASRLTAILDLAGFPRVFSGLSPEPSLPADTPDSAIARSAAVRAAADSVVKVTASTPECRGPLSAQVGSGWVSAPERIVTNAHVVAGGQQITVRVGGVGPE